MGGWALPLVSYRRGARTSFVTGNRPAAHGRLTIAPRPGADRKWAGHQQPLPNISLWPGSGVMECSAPFGQSWGDLRRSLPAAFTRRMTPGVARRLC